MPKPNFSKISETEWETAYESGLVLVEVAHVWVAEVPSAKGGNYQFVARDTYGAFMTDVWRVTNHKTNKTQTYFGETAWMTARRDAADIDFGAWAL